MTDKYIKKVQILLFIMIIGLVSLVRPLPAAAAGETANLDTVIVLDVSGSMKTTDEKRISLEGAKLFIDMMESTNSRAGFLAFDSAVTTKYDLTTLSSSADKQAIKQAIGALEYKRGDTNIGEALKASVQMLETAQDTGNKKMILLFTDGNIDLDNRSNVESEAEKLSMQTARDVTAQAAEEGIRIFTIGLNAGKNERFQMDPTLITEIADTADGICRIVSTADELPGAFNDIFAHMIDSEITDLGEITISSPDVYEEKEIHIPNESVLEANVVLFTGDSDPLDEIRITDPDQKVLEPNDEQLFLSDSSVYQLLKILTPKAGDWLLQLKGKEGSIVHVDLVFNYDITLETSLEADDENDLVHVSAHLLKKDEILTDEAIYSQLLAKATISNTNGTHAIYSMELNEDYSYTCDVPVAEGEAVTILVHVEGANMYRNSKVLKYSRIPPEADDTNPDSEQAQSGQIGSSGSDTEAADSQTKAIEQTENGLLEEASTENGADTKENPAVAGTEDGSNDKTSDKMNGSDPASKQLLSTDDADGEGFDEDFQVTEDLPEDDTDSDSEDDSSVISRLTSSQAIERILQPDVAIAAGLIVLILLLLFLMRKR